MKTAKELIEELKEPEKNYVLNILGENVDCIHSICYNAIPIYTLKNPNPKNHKEDCPLIVQYKMRMRESMRKKIEVIISEYETKVKEGT